MTSPTERTLGLLRKRGYPLVQVVERWNPHVRVRQDLFGIIDVLAVGKDIVGVQCTSRDHISDHMTKMRESNRLPTLLGAGMRVLLHGWKKKGRRWTCREIEFTP